MNIKNYIEITVALSNNNVRKYVEGAMADAIVEARGRLRYLSECEDSRAEDMQAALNVLTYIHSCFAELQTLDG